MHACRFVSAWNLRSRATHRDYTNTTVIATTQTLRALWERSWVRFRKKRGEERGVNLQDSECRIRPLRLQNNLVRCHPSPRRARLRLCGRVLRSATACVVRNRRLHAARTREDGLTGRVRIESWYAHATQRAHNYANHLRRLSFPVHISMGRTMLADRRTRPAPVGSFFGL